MSFSRYLKQYIVCAVILSGSSLVALAQYQQEIASNPTPQALYINSVPLQDMRTDLVPGVVYAPVEALAEASAARYSHSPNNDIVNLEYGPIVLTLAVYKDAAQAATAQNAMQGRGGATVPDFAPAALYLDGVIYAPVEAVSEALGAQVNQGLVNDIPSLVVLYPRASLLSVRYFAAGRSGSPAHTESFELEFSDVVPIEERKNTALGVVTYRFSRADSSETQEYQGKSLYRGRLTSDQGWVDLRLELTRGNDSRYLNERRDGRYVVVIDIAPTDSFQDTQQGASNQATNPTAASQSASTGSSITLADIATGLPNRPQVLLDPAHGGLDTGMDLGGSNEAEQVFTLASNMQSALAARGLQVGLTRAIHEQTPLTSRSQQAVGVPLFISLHAADIPSNTFNIYYLGEASQDSSLNLALQQNAESAVNSDNTDAIRRQVLLNLLSDISAGEDYARQFTRLLADEGLRFQSVDAAPIYVLSGAAGRGVLLELSRRDLRDAQGIERLAAALSDAVVTIVSNSN